MDRRKDTPFTGVKLPADYLRLVEDVFNKNFSKYLLVETSAPKTKTSKSKKSTKSEKERFVAHGEVYTDELILAVSLQHPGSLRMNTCYASVDYPPPKSVFATLNRTPSSSDFIQVTVNYCVDAIASFFDTYFREGRPVDYDDEYRQSWTAVDLDKNTRVFLRINRDNLDLEAQADALLATDEDMKKKKNLH